jgi:murein DD-endopeptidase MepM/ murein hydrolase activator NlpD
MLTGVDILHERLKGHSSTFHKVVDFDPVKEKLVHLDLSEHNAGLSKIDLADTEAFSKYISGELSKAKAKYGIGGYDELRGLYERSKVFGDDSDEPRRLHIGVDIWGEEGTKVYAPLGGIVHSYGYNNNFGDYGATLVLLHQLDTVTFYTLYGHLSHDDISKVTEYQYIHRGFEIGHFGNARENGNWPPHLHFQVIKDMENYKGDYPGVCRFSQREKYLINCPDPDLILNMRRYS